MLIYFQILNFLYQLEYNMHWDKSEKFLTVEVINMRFNQQFGFIKNANSFCTAQNII